ncbi:MAG: TIGR03067 domain-containing protein [Paludisphaera borealis]|uniref:TIGR03067 domain-containing protein n=1 Tax=Paludisphaera borealis TaxID=1387353 RepID=UPI0028480449|nr:TIGR03067 domain-containing protein [Paludisphaera borealis]MDR3622288.1 TIGR03067 domain-containing protein [Paludisphaera borealis]
MFSIQRSTSRVRRLKWAGAAAAILIAGTSYAAEVPAGVEGTWTLVRSEVDGATTLYRGGELSHESERYTSSLQGAIRHKLKLNSASKPRTIDWVRIEAPDEGKASPGIYKIEGDVITENFARPGTPRPSDFTTRPNSGYRRSVWKRTGESPKPAPADDAKAIEGTWELTEVEFNGESTPVHASRTVQGEDASTTFEVAVKGRKAWDASAKPATVDLTPESARDASASIRGVYKIEGDVYTEVLAQPGQPRPTSFSAPAGSGRTLLVYHRAKS